MLVERMNDESESIWIRDNTCAILEALRNISDDEVKKFSKKRTKYVYETMKKKK
jgi:hypothetical protein